MNERTKAILDNNPALRMLADLDGGNTASEFAHELNQLVQAASLIGKKGELNLKIIIKPTGAGKVEIEAELKTKEPKPGTHATTFFTNEQFELLRTDPNQKEIEFERVPKAGAN